MQLPRAFSGGSSGNGREADLDETIVMAVGDKLVNGGPSQQLRRSRRSGNGPLLRIESRLGPTSTSPKLPSENRNLQGSAGVLLTQRIVSRSAERTGSNRSPLFQKRDDKLENQRSFASKKSKKIPSSVQVPRGDLVPRQIVGHRPTKREAHWQNQDSNSFGLRYSSRGRQRAEPLVSHQHPQFPRYYGPFGRSNDPSNSTTTDPGSGGTHPYNVVGLLLAAASVIFIIIGIAFVFTRVRRRKPSPDEPDTGDLEMVETSKPDPYAEWLNMPEEEPPKPALKKQVKTAVRTVSRKMSLTPKPPEEVFKPGVPEHLRYQLKQIYVY